MMTRKTVEAATLALAFLGFCAVVYALVGDPSTTAGQIAVLVAVLAAVWIAERVWKSTR